MRYFLLSTGAVLALVLGAAACSSARGELIDGGASDAAGHGGYVHDAAASDAAPVDGGGTPMDAGAIDLGETPVDDAGVIDAGSSDDAGIVTCGSVICGDGMRCCSDACSICGPVGALCPAIACYDAGMPPDAGGDGGHASCRAMEAHGSGTCDHLLGYAFDGATCTAVRGCSCAGPDCGGIHTSLASCTAATAPCAAGVLP